MNGDFDVSGIFIVGLLFWAWYASAKADYLSQRAEIQKANKGA